MKVAFLLPLALCGAPAFAARDVLSPLPPGAVRLTGGLKADIDNSVVHWHKGKVPYHAFAEFFRRGRPQFALGEMWGKFVRSGAMQYRHASDPELAAVLRAAVDDILATQRDNGSFSCVPPELQPDDKGGDLWERKYVMLGLEDYYEWVSRDASVKAALVGHANCILRQIGPPPKRDIRSLGWSPNHIESSTLLEPMVRLYGLTGDEAYLEFARYVVRSGGAQGYDLVRAACDRVKPWRMAGPYPKAYEMLSFFEGLAEYYRVTDEPRALEACKALFDGVLEHELTIVGNGGGDMPHHPRVAGEAWDNTALEQTNPDIRRMMETCTGVTWLKFASQVLRLTGDPRAAEAIERYVLNGLLGAMKPGGDGFSYVNLLNGSKVTDYGWGWDFPGGRVTCCNLNGPMGLAYIPFVAVMQGAEGPVVNLYNPLEAEALTPSGAKVRLSVKTDFPSYGKVAIRVNPDREENFAVTVRLPGWSAETKVRVNGEEILSRTCAPVEYVPVRRTWRPGDELEVVLSMTARIVDAPHGSNRAGDGFQAVTYGPLVLCRDEGTDPDYADPVAIYDNSGGRGIADVRPVRPTLPTTRHEFAVRTLAGEIRMIDYASQNGWNGKRIQTWLPVAASESKQKGVSTK